MPRLYPAPPIPWFALARKEYTVDQAEILAALQAQRNIHAMAANTGFCLSLALDWASRTISGRLPSASTYANPTSDGMKECVANHVTGYFASGVGIAQITGITRGMGLVPREIASGSAIGSLGRMGAPAVVAGAVLKYPCRQGVGVLKFGLAGSGHAIGFRVTDTTFRFFDPNFGSYVAPNRDTFNKALQGLLTNVYSSVSTYAIYDFTQRLTL